MIQSLHNLDFAVHLLQISGIQLGFVDDFYSNLAEKKVILNYCTYINDLLIITFERTSYDECGTAFS